MKKREESFEADQVNGSTKNGREEEEEEKRHGMKRQNGTIVE